MGMWVATLEGVKNLPLSITVISCGTETETVLRVFLLEKENTFMIMFFLCMDGCRWALNHCRLTGAWTHGETRVEGHGPETTVQNRPEPLNLMLRHIHTLYIVLIFGPKMRLRCCWIVFSSVQCLENVITIAERILYFRHLLVRHRTDRCE